MSRVPTETVICDIDGCLFRHSDNYGGWGYKVVEAWQSMTDKQKEEYILPGVREKFAEWNSLEYYIVIITAREEAFRVFTEDQFDYFGLKYDQMVMEVTNARRHLINDKKKWGDAAFSYNLERDVGLNSVSLNP